MLGYGELKQNGEVVQASTLLYATAFKSASNQPSFPNEHQENPSVDKLA
jgi:hypothetical protein